MSVPSPPTTNARSNATDAGSGSSPASTSVTSAYRESTPRIPSAVRAASGFCRLAMSSAFGMVSILS